MFERFTTSAREVVAGAQAHARQLGHPYIGTEHLLLALLGPGTGPAGAVLRRAGVEPGRVRDDIDRLIGTAPGVLTGKDAAALRAVGIDLEAVVACVEQSLGPDALASPSCPPPRRGLLGRRPNRESASPRFGPRTKKVLELSLREALALRHSSVGAEHILLALLRQGDGLAVTILTDAGLDLHQLRHATLSALDAAA